MDHPFKYEDPTNHRIVTNVKNTDGKVMGCCGLLYVASVSSYMKSKFRVNGDPIKLGLMCALSLPASYAYAKMAFDSAENEAAVMNNSRE